MSFFIQAFKTDTFAALIAASIVASLLFALRSLPGELWTLIKWRYTCSLTVFSEDAAFDRVSEWLGSLEGAKRSRQLRLGSSYDQNQERDVDNLSPGLGKHLFWYKSRPIIVERSLPDKGAGPSYKRQENIHIYTLGSEPALLQDLVAEIRDARHRMKGDHLDVFLYRARWRLACRKQKRALETVTLVAGQKERVVDDAQAFLSSRSRYNKLGVPWRRGYLFEGPPGTGKTSMALALASELSRPIYALNLGSINNDDELIDAVCDVPEHGILLIEDIDAAKAGAARKKVEPKPVSPNEKSTEDSRSVSLSGLLNVIDGVFSRDGRILIMTTNHPEKIDPALLRPGRADMRVVIDELEREEAIVMATRFLGSEQVARAFVNGVRLPMPAAELQERLILHIREGWKVRAA